MSTIYDKQREASPALHKIGVWATYWWAGSCAFILILVWQGRRYYTDPATTFSGWVHATGSAFRASVLLQIALILLVTGWITGSWLWFTELKRKRISYRVALKDLFLRVRR